MNKSMMYIIYKSLVWSLAYFLMMVGFILAVVISWESNHSIGWAIGHGFSGWLYIFWHFDYKFAFSSAFATVIVSMLIRYNDIKYKYQIYSLDWAKELERLTKERKDMKNEDDKKE